MKTNIALFPTLVSKVPLHPDKLHGQPDINHPQPSPSSQASAHHQFPSIVPDRYYAGERKYTVDSPDGKIQLAIIQTDAGELTYQLSVKRKQVIDASALGFKTEDGLTFPFRGWKMGKVTRNKVNSVWKPLWGKRAVVPDKYNEMKLSFVNEAKSSDALEVVARAYNEGVAFRYVSPRCRFCIGTYYF